MIASEKVNSGRRAQTTSLLGIIDQGFTAIVNLALVIFAAQGGTNSVAAFALVTAVYFGLLTIGRALLAEPLLALPLAERGGPYLRCAFTLSFAGGLFAMLSASLAFPFEGNYLVIGAATSILLGAEFLRIRAYAFEKPIAALTATLALACVVLAGGLLDQVHDSDRWQRLLVVWAVAGLVSAILALILTRARTVRHATAKCWYRTKIWKHAKSLLVDAIGIVLIAHVSLYLINHFGEAGDVAAVRALSVVLSPLSLVFTGLTLSLTPLMTRKGDQAANAIKAFWVVILGVSLVGGGLALSVGQSVITYFFGIDATPSRLALLVAVVSAVMFAVGSPWLAQVRVSGQYGLIGWVRLISAVVLVAVLGALASTGSLPVIFFIVQGTQALLIALTARALVSRAKREILVSDALGSEVRTRT